MESSALSHHGEVGAGEGRRGRLTSMPEISVVPIHSDAVASVAVVPPEFCLSGSKDGVRMIAHSVFHCCSFGRITEVQLASPICFMPL